MFREPLVILDFETTGLRPERGDRIMEIALVRIENGRLGERYQSLVNSGTRLPPFVTSYTGITQAMVDEAPPAAEVMRNIASFIGGTPVVAHCALYDQSFYMHECWRQGMSRNIDIEPFICSMRLARRLYPDVPSHTLTALATALGLKYKSIPHRATADAEVTAQLMLRLVGDLATVDDSIEVTIDMLRRVQRTPLPRVPQAVTLESLCA